MMKGLCCLTICVLAASMAAAEVIERTATSSDGISIAYDVRGAGETTVVLVHCWSCDRSFWREQVDVLAQEYRVVSLDLPGHGASGADRDDWSVTGLAEDVEAVLDDMGAERVILVGHSMGGPVSLAAAGRMKERVIGVVCVDTLHDADQRPPPGMIEQFAATFEADFDGTMRQMVGAMFPQGADPAVQQWVVEQAVKADPRAAVELLRSFEDVDTQALLSNAAVPIRCVNAAALPPAIPPTAIETNRKYADFDAVLVDGVGHYLLLERPEEVNDKLRVWLRELAPATGAETE